MSHHDGDEPSLALKLVSLRDLRRALSRSIRCLSAEKVLIWSHHGFGDQVTVVPAVEAWSRAVPHVLFPTKPMYAEMTREMYAYLRNVTVVDLPSDDPTQEPDGIRRLAQFHGVPVVDGGRSIYSWARDAFPEFGIFRALNIALLHGGHELSSEAFRAHLLSRDQVPAPEVPYAFVDHHPDTYREIPQSVLAAIEERGLELIYNQRKTPLLSLIELMDRASELHLVTSSPLCLALTANLGTGLRVKYRHHDLHPLKMDYAADWREVNLTSEGSTRPVDRLEDTLGFSELRSSLLHWVARASFLRAASRLLERVEKTAGHSAP